MKLDATVGPTLERRGNTIIMHNLHGMEGEDASMTYNRRTGGETSGWKASENLTPLFDRPATKRDMIHSYQNEDQDPGMEKLQTMIINIQNGIPASSEMSSSTTIIHAPVSSTASGPAILSSTYSDDNITKGFFHTQDRFFVTESLDKASFKVGDEVMFSDGSVKTIKDVQAHGPNVHYFYKGEHLDPTQVAGKPMQKIVGGSHAPAPVPSSTTTTTTASGPAILSGNYSDDNITKGFYHTQDRFFVAESLDKASFKIGDQVQFADGSVRIIKDVQAHGPNVHYFYKGEHLDPTQVAGLPMQKI